MKGLCVCSLGAWGLGSGPQKYTITNYSSPFREGAPLNRIPELLGAVEDML